MADTELVICNPFGQQMTDVKKFASLDASRQEGNYGEMTLDLFPNFDPTYIQREWRIEYKRNGKMFGETSWIIRHFLNTTNENGENIIRIWARDGMEIVRRTIIPYNNGNPTTQKQAPADDVIKAFMRENRGSLATDTTRDGSAYLSIAGDVHLAPQVTKYDVSMRLCLPLFQEICQDSLKHGTYLTFDVVWINSVQWEFRTYTGQRGINHSFGSGNVVILTSAGRNLATPAYEEDGSDEINFVYATGQGVGNARPIATSQDAASIGASPYGRIEGTVDASSTADATALQAEADSYRFANRVKQKFSGKLQDSDGATFGIDYDYGDLVTVEDQGRSFDCHVDAMHVTVNRDSQDQLDVFARSESYV